MSGGLGHYSTRAIGSNIDGLRYDFLPSEVLLLVGFEFSNLEGIISREVGIQTKFALDIYMPTTLFGRMAAACDASGRVRAPRWGPCANRFVPDLPDNSFQSLRC